MKKYSKYKDSGIEWLGEIPEHWKAIKIQYLANDENSLFIDGDWIESSVIEETGIRYLTTGNIGAGFYKEQGSGFISENTFLDLNCTEVYPGDLIISRLNEPIGRACIIPDLGHRIVTSVDNVILRPKKGYHIGFLKHLMNSAKYSSYTGLIARGATMKRISRGLLGRITLPIPSFNEQNIIASFLDHKTTQVDTLIEKKEQLVEKLTLKRQAIINEAVTKGLNPNVPMKDSGIEWLGEVPEHWKVVSLKYLVNHSTTKGNGKSKLKVALENIESQTGVYLESEKKEFEGELKEFKKDDILFNKLRPYLAKVFKAPEDGECVSELLVFTCLPNVLQPDFLFWKLISQQIISVVDSNTYGAKMPRVGTDFMLNLPIALPLKDEQEGIIKHIADKIKIIDATSEKAKESIDKLKLYRQSLISEAVTGKIDLRDWKEIDSK